MKRNPILPPVVKFNLIPLFLFVATLCLPAAFAETAKDTAWEIYISSQKKLQVALHELVRLHQPELKPVIDKGREWQLGLADLRSRRFYHLLKIEPQRIARTGGFSEFVNFSWSDQDEETLRVSDSDFRKLAERVEKLSREVSADPTFSEVETQLKLLEKDPHYLEILARFRFVSKDVEDALNAGTEIPRETSLK